MGGQGKWCIEVLNVQLNERSHQDMKQLFKDMAKDNACVPQLVQSAGSFEPCPARDAEARFLHRCILRNVT